MVVGTGTYSSNYQYSGPLPMPHLCWTPAACPAVRAEERYLKSSIDYNSLGTSLFPTVFLEKSMVYLKKKVKKRPTADQIRHQATKALTKACKLTKTQLIMKVVRSTKKGQENGRDDVGLAQKLEGLKAFSHVTCGERLTKNVFGEFVPPLEDEAEREIEETMSKSGNIIECKKEWIDRLKDVHNLMERQSKAAQAKHASDLRKQGLVQDAYGGIHEIRHQKRTLPETSDGTFRIERRSKRFREEDKVTLYRGEDKAEKGAVRTRKHVDERKAPLMNRKERRKINFEATQEVSVGGRTKTIIPGPPIGTVHGGVSTVEGHKMSNTDKMMEDIKLKPITAVHPSWAAKQKQKEKLSKVLDLNASSNRKKIKFDD